MQHAVSHMIKLARPVRHMTKSCNAFIMNDVAIHFGMKIDLL